MGRTYIVLTGLFIILETISGLPVPGLHSHHNNYVNLDSLSGNPYVEKTAFDYAVNSNNNRHFNPYAHYYGGEGNLNVFRQDPEVPVMKPQFVYPFQTIYVVTNSRHHSNHPPIQSHVQKQDQNQIRNNFNPFTLASSLLSNFDNFGQDRVAATPYFSSGGESGDNLDLPLSDLKDLFKSQFMENQGQGGDNIHVQGKFPSQNSHPHQALAHSQIHIQIVPDVHSGSTSGFGFGSSSESHEESNLANTGSLADILKYNIEQAQFEFQPEIKGDSGNADSNPSPSSSTSTSVSTSTSSVSTSTSASTSVSNSNSSESDLVKSEAPETPVNVQIKTQIPAEQPSIPVGKDDNQDDLTTISILPSHTSGESSSSSSSEISGENDPNIKLTIIALGDSEMSGENSDLADTVIISGNNDPELKLESDEAVRDFVKEQELEEKLAGMQPELLSSSSSSSASSEEKVPVTLLLGGTDSDIVAFKSGISSSTTTTTTTSTTTTTTEKPAVAVTEMELEAELTTEADSIKSNGRDDLETTGNSTPAPNSNQLIQDDEQKVVTTMATDLARDDNSDNNMTTNVSLLDENDSLTTIASPAADDVENTDNLTTTVAPSLVQNE